MLLHYISYGTSLRVSIVMNWMPEVTTKSFKINKLNTNRIKCSQYDYCISTRVWPESLYSTTVWVNCAGDLLELRFCMATTARCSENPSKTWDFAARSVPSSPGWAGWWGSRAHTTGGLSALGQVLTRCTVAFSTWNMGQSLWVSITFLIGTAWLYVKVLVAQSSFLWSHGL